ncbi:DNA polymerase epsilon catalytic subunit A, partial [Salmonella enterica]
NIISANANFSYMLLINTKVTIGNAYIYGEYICYYVFMSVICFISQFAKKDGNIAAGRHSVINFVNWLRVFLI